MNNRKKKVERCKNKQEKESFEIEKKKVVKTKKKLESC
jgi:hypothetical protein